MEGRNESAPLGDLGPVDETTVLLFPDDVTRILTLKTNYFGLLLVFIPIITILGNLLVIVSVLRFKVGRSWVDGLKSSVMFMGLSIFSVFETHHGQLNSYALHSAINFLILGLAVADLLVALFVMPYAVYVHVSNGEWYLGNLMCDIYMATDVSCSTASILLLAVISFDRYRAVSRPIQYSRQAQNIQRVVIILVFIWMISLLVASPIVLGVNSRPPAADPHECRFYNAAFSIGSSIISFVIPCVLVLFVYIRIMIALKKRERAAKMRRISHLQHSNTSSARAGSSVEEDEAGRIVAGPAVNVMMLALPSMSRRMRRFERHRAAIQHAGELPGDVADDESDIDADVDATAVPSAAAAAGVPPVLMMMPLMPRRSSSLAAVDAPTHTSTHSLPLEPLHKEKQVVKEHTSSTPRSSVDSLDENVHVVTNDFVSDVYTTMSRHSSEMADSSGTQSDEFKEKEKSKSSRKFRNLARNYSMHARRKSQSEQNVSVKGQPSNGSISPRTDLIPSIIRQLSIRSPLIFRSLSSRGQNKTEPVVLSNPTTEAVHREGNGTCDGHRRATTSLTVNSLTETETISASQKISDEQNCRKLDGIAEGVQGTSFSRSTTVNSELLGSPEQVDCSSSFIMENKPVVNSVPEENQPTVKFSMTVRAKAASPSQRVEDARLKGSFDEGRRRSQDIIRILTRNSNPGEPKSREHPPRLPRLDSTASSDKSRSRNNSLKSADSRNLSQKKRSNGGLAVRLVKRTMKHEQSLKRKVSKSQRKEKRATKTLGIVVGIFLICWVPFFTLNILNAVCVVLNKESCQVGFGPFFYTTWIGYMNSFMNPIIYTIFNTEFRRAFKSLIFGMQSSRNRNTFQRAQQRVHV